MELAKSDLPRPGDADVSDSAISEPILTFIGQCQVAAGACATSDLAARATVVWKCLESFPRGVPYDELAASATCVFLMARGYFLSSRAAPPNRRRPGRRHAASLIAAVNTLHSVPEVTLQWISRDIHVSCGYLSRVIVANTGYPFRTHLGGVRLIAAVFRLGLQGGPLSAVAAKAGYRSTGEMDRQFRRWFGLSPREFRALLSRVGSTGKLGSAPDAARVRHSRRGRAE